MIDEPNLHSAQTNKELVKTVLHVLQDGTLNNQQIAETILFVLDLSMRPNAVIDVAFTDETMPLIGPSLVAYETTKI